MFSRCDLILVRAAGIEPARISPRSLKDRASTYSATPAICVGEFAEWCPWQASNLHALQRPFLRRVRLPVPPQGRSLKHGALRKTRTFTPRGART